jgi:hypothetical protein
LITEVKQPIPSDDSSGVNVMDNFISDFFEFMREILPSQQNELSESKLDSLNNSKCEDSLLRETVR